MGRYYAAALAILWLSAAAFSLSYADSMPRAILRALTQ